MTLRESIAKCLKEVKDKKPLIHHITNYVTVNDCANMALALGASPVMADDIDEVEEMVLLAAALVINMGTLNARTIESMLVAGKKAKESGVPVIFDPVGVGATNLRTSIAAKIIKDVRPSVIRGNMSEIKMIAGINAAIRGVDSVAEEEDGEYVASTLSRKLGCVVAITGKRDIIANYDRVLVIENGHYLLAQVTGTGCMATTLIGCFCGSGGDLLTATAAGIMTMGLAGEVAERSIKPGEGIGTFRMRLFDAVSGLTPEGLLKGGMISEV